MAWPDAGRSKGASVSESWRTTCHQHAILGIGSCHWVDLEEPTAGVDSEKVVLLFGNTITPGVFEASGSYQVGLSTSDMELRPETRTEIHLSWQYILQIVSSNDHTKLLPGLVFGRSRPVQIYPHSTIETICCHGQNIKTTR